MVELTPRHVAILERLIERGHSVVAFPLYANAVGIRKGNCAVLLDPVAHAGFRVFGEPCLLLDGNLTVRIREKDRSWFVWKKQRIEATPTLITELDAFVAEVRLQLEAQA